MNENISYTVNSAAERLGIHPSTVRRAIVSGLLPATKHGERMYIITGKALSEWDAVRGGAGPQSVSIVVDQLNYPRHAYLSDAEAEAKLSELLPGWEAMDPAADWPWAIVVLPLQEADQ